MNVNVLDLTALRFSRCLSNSATEFEGNHCEILKGLGSSSSSKELSGANSSQSSSTWGLTFFISFLLSTVGILCIIYVRRNVIGVHVTPNYGESEESICDGKEGGEGRKEINGCEADVSPTSVVEDMTVDVKSTKNRQSHKKGFDFDEMIEIEEDMEEAQFV